MTTTRHPLRPINLDLHSALDYVFVATALAAPYALGFSDNKKATRSLQAIFLTSVCKDLCTRYRFSLTKKIPIGVHLSLDLVVGGATALAPFALGFYKELKPWQTAAFVLLGAGVAPFVGMTHPYNEKEKRQELAATRGVPRVRSLMT